MRRPLLFLVIGCSAPSIPAPQPTNQVAPSSAGELRKRAELALRTDTPIDLERPFTKKPNGREATVDLFVQACNAGDHSACRTAMDVAGDDHPEIQALVAGACSGGDVPSCRALPIYDVTHHYSNLLGAAIRSEECFALDSDRCDRTRLRAECAAGFALSCYNLSIRVNPREPDAAALGMRAGTLATEGCDAGIQQECILVPADARKARELAAEERLCLVFRACRGLGKIHQAAGRLIEARDAFERSCEYGQMYCAELGGAYVRGNLPEPVPGRGQKLLGWACASVRRFVKPDEFYRKQPDCKLVK